MITTGEFRICGFIYLQIVNIVSIKDKRNFYMVKFNSYDYIKLDLIICDVWRLKGIMA